MREATDRSIYGSYGIRGIVGEDIDAALAYKLAQAFVTVQKPHRVGVGRDGRVSSKDFSEAIVAGMRDAGVDVIDFGLVPVDTFYFAVGHYRCDGGAMATASHNPSEWNGIKFVDADAQLLIGEQNRDLARIMERGSFIPASGHTGHYEEVDPVHDFVTYIYTNVGLAHTSPLKVVIDPGNGAIARTAVAVMQTLPCTWSGINLEVNGLFPGRGPDPKKQGALDPLGRAVRERGADVGVAFDADGDRMFLVDEKGVPLCGEATGLVLARAFLKRHPGASIVYNVVCSHVVPETIVQWGGMPVRAGIGSVNMRPALMRSRAVLGIETSGHYIIPALNFIDSALVPMAFALKEIAAAALPLSKLAEGFDPYAHEFIDMPSRDVDAVYARVRTAHAGAIRDEIDGISVEYPDWWFNVRPSRSEPLFRLTVEAKTKTEMEQHRDEILQLIRKPG